jgi:hypothetical protein
MVSSKIGTGNSIKYNFYYKGITMKKLYEELNKVGIKIGIQMSIVSILEYRKKIELIESNFSSKTDYINSHLKGSYDTIDAIIAKLELLKETL